MHDKEGSFRTHSHQSKKVKEREFLNAYRHFCQPKRRVIILFFFIGYEVYESVGRKIKSLNSILETKTIYAAAVAATTATLTYSKSEYMKSFEVVHF